MCVECTREWARKKIKLNISMAVIPTNTFYYITPYDCRKISLVCCA